MKLNYKVLGEGQAIIVLHGLFGSLDNWMTLGKEWSENFQIWLVDQRNHGQSEHSEDFTYKAMANDLNDFIVEHEIENPIILGHSMGGKTAMEFAVNFSKKLKSLIVVDIAPVSYQVHHYPIIEALEAVKLDEISERSEADEVLAKHISEMGIRQFLLKNLYWKEKNQLAWRFNLAAIKKEIIPISKWSISEGKFEGKTLFVKGENSDYITASHASAIADKFPNYELVEINNAGHWVHAEAKKVFSETILNFISE
tara:strand:+ start:603 stop:1367 length:765 start_codon:yes stop_codon:yes gene_type:complete